MNSKRNSLVFITLIGLLNCYIALAHGGGGGHGGGHSGGFGGGHSHGFQGGHWGGGHFGGLHHHGYGGVGFYSGSPFFWPYFSYPSYYPSAPAIVVPETPPVYIEQEIASKGQAPESHDWNYCSTPQGYYPHVKECPSGWQRVDPQPTGEASGFWYYCTRPAGYYPYIKLCSTMWQQIVP